MAELIDFSQVKDIKINGKMVTYIRQEYGVGNSIWRKPFEFPAMAFVLQYDVENSNETTVATMLPHFVCDKNGRLLRLGNNAPSKPYGEYIAIDYSKLAIYKDLRMVAYTIENSTELKNFPKNAKRAIVQWTTSDDISGKIRLYAAKANTNTTAVNVYKTARSMPTLGYDIYHAEEDEHMYETVYETDVLVETNTPFITLSTGAVARIASIRTNFDEYKTKYDTATAGKFPKSTYPYLCGVVKIDCKIPTMGFDGTQGLYITFSVNR